MDLWRFVPEVKSWTCAAGLLVLSAGAGYCVYRRLRRGGAPPAHTQPPAEPLDVLEEPSDPPSILQVVEPNLQFLPKEVHEEPSPDVLVLVVEPNLQFLPTELVREEPSPDVLVLPVGAGEVKSSWCNVQFLSTEFCGSQSWTSVINKKYFLGMIRGPESRFYWFNTTETLFDGVPYYSKYEDSFTGVQVVSGRVTQVISCNHVETTIALPRPAHVETTKKVTCTSLHMDADGELHTSTWEHDDTQCSPYDDAEESRYDLSPEEMEVPFISCHLTDRGVTDIGLKLPALRQAFSTFLTSIHNQNFLFVVGKKIVKALAAANNQDVSGVQLAYEALIRFLRCPANQVSIEAELSGVQLYHYNILDVFFELLLFGYFKNSSVPDAFVGGFLERLVELVRMWTMDECEPAAEQYFTLLIEKLTVLCEVLFEQPLELYSDPAALASAVSSLLTQHVQLMMDTLESL